MARNQYGQDDISHTFTERALSETWEERKARRAAEQPKPSAKLQGRPRAEWVWSADKKRKFTKLWMSGTTIPVIMSELGIGSKQAASQAARTLGLPTRLRRVGERPLVKARVEGPEMQHLRRQAAATGTSLSKYVQRLIRIDMGATTR